MQEFLTRIEGFSQKRLALLAYELQQRVSALEEGAHEPIAIVGIGCRFPGGVTDPASYWTLLRNQVDAVREVPADRWDIDAFYDADPDVPGKMSTRWGGFLDQVDRFDPQFFGIAPREAETMDPQQRLLLEVAWEALEHAGLSADRIFGAKAGVFVGMSAGDYYQIMRTEGLDGFDAYTASGTAHSIASGRVSYALGLHGTSVSIDTACSSSAVAIHQAVHALRRTECDFALAGGVNLILAPDITIALSKSHMMAPDGRCKTFDARANGFVRGEGCGVLVLKRLSDATRDGDRIVAVIRGSATNQDGRSNGLTAPNGQSQEAVLRDALADARLTPDRVSYVEAHGTGTSLGDPIEINALAAVFAEQRSGDPLLVGSVKTNIGHLEAAAGVAAVIKVALALYHRELPAQLHFETPNPFIAWSELPIAVATQLGPWPAPTDAARVAGVSSFGFSGTNAHLVLEEAPKPTARVDATPGNGNAERPLHLLALSARQPEALDALARAYDARLANTDDALADLAFSANTGRAQLTHRLAMTAATRDEARTRLATWRASKQADDVATGHKAPGRRPKIAFVFGASAPAGEVSRALYDTQPVFRAAIEQCETAIRTSIPTLLTSVLFATEQAAPAADASTTRAAQFAAEYALATLWMSWGVRPSVVLGRGVGAYVATCVAGALGLDAAITLAASNTAEAADAARLARETPHQPTTIDIVPADTGLATLATRGYDTFLEIGQDPTADRPAGARWLASPRTGNESWPQLLTDLAALYANGVDVDWVGFDQPYARRKVDLPTYPFQRERYWIPQRARAAEPVPTRLASLLYDVTWRPLGDSGATVSHPAPARLAAETLPHIAAASVETGFDRYADFQRELDHLSTAYIVQALRRLGWDFPVDTVVETEALRTQLGVLARHGSLFRRLLAILGEDGILAREGAGWRVAAAPDVPVPASYYADLRQRYPAFGAELTLTERCAESLAPALRGEVDPLQLLFPGGSLGDAEKLYRDSPAARTYNGAIADIVQSIAAEHGATGRPLRVLEIGAGTGGTTSYVLPALAGHAVEYTFTDVSPLFAARARDTFQAYPFLRDATLDISTDPTTQGFAPGAYDVILGSNVIHATPDVGVTMAHVHRMLAPGGLVVLLEGTTPARFGDLTVGLTDGWWAFTDTERRSYALMPRDRWLTVFTESGFADAVAIPGDGAGPSLSQQAIFVARAERATAARGVTGQRWTIVADSSSGVGATLAESFRADGDQVDVVTVQDGDAWRQPLRAALAAMPAGVIYAVGLETPLDDTAAPDALATRERIALGGWLDVVQDVIAAGGTPPAVYLITRGAQTTQPADSADPAQATLWGMSHTVALEHPELSCVRIDLDAHGLDDRARDGARIAELVRRPAGDDQIAVRGARTLGRRLARHAAPSVATTPVTIRGDVTYLVTGGLRGLGLRVAEWLADRGARHLVLMGRRAPDATADAVRQRLAQRGVTVHVETGDVGVRDDVARVLAHVTRAMPRLAGVVHAAGVLDDGVLAQQTWDRFSTVLGPKVYGTWHLHTLTRDLDFLVFFSSGASLAGSAGQANHAAANAFEDALAHRRQAAGLPTVSINWGPWSEIGAAADRRISARNYMGAITPTDGLAALDWAMRRVTGSGLFAQAQIAVLPAEWDKLLAQYGQAVPPFFTDLAAELRAQPRTESRPESRGTGATTTVSSAPSIAPDTALRERIRAATPNRRRLVLQEFVRAQAITVLGTATNRQLDVTLPLRELGLDSLMAVELRNILGTATGKKLPATLTFDHPTVDALVDYLIAEAFADEMAVAAGPTRAPTSTPTRASTPLAAATSAADTFDDLSADDLAALLAAQLDSLSDSDA